TGFIDAVCGFPRYVQTNCRLVTSLLKSRRESLGREARTLLRRFNKAPGVRFAFNAPLSGEASYAAARFCIADISRIRALHGGTLNDVLLTLVGTALQRYAVKHGIETEGRFLRVLVPSNVRVEETKDRFGNFVSMAPVLVPLGEMPASERLHAIMEY